MPRQAILILTDTQGANVIGCYTGRDELGTPNLDRLAGQGVRFQRAYTCAPVCGPARSALFTGLYPHANGVLANDMAPHAGLPTLGMRLARAGIAAGYIGKWHLDGTDYFGDGRCPPGWDPRYWFDGRNYLESLPDEAARDLSRRVLGPEEVRLHGITAAFTHAHRTVDRVLAFLAAHRQEDFFLVVSIDEPHGPCICPEPFVSAFEEFRLEVPTADDPLLGKPDSQTEWARHSAASRQHLIREGGRVYFRNPRYFGCNSFCDHEIGRGLAAIETHLPGALVIHTSDHGDMFQSHRLAGKGPAVYDEITRIPLLVRWPGVTPPGAVSPGPVSHIDLLPTLLEFFGVPVPDLAQGRSLLPQCGDPAQRVNEHVFIEFNRFELDHDGFGSFAPIRCVFDGRHKLALNLLDTDELYDLKVDPYELRNRIADPACASIRDGLHDILLDWMDRTRDPLRGPPWGRRAWRVAGGSSWGGPTRPRPFDPAWPPPTLLYDTGRPIDRYFYAKD